MANLSEKRKELENEIELLNKDKSRIEILKEAKKKCRFIRKECRKKFSCW